MREFIKSFGLYFAWLMSLIAVFGSLYASEILGFKPCSFCWYQRIFLFPLAIILGIATYKKNKTVIKYILSLPILGAMVALLQTFFSLINIENPFCGLECQNGDVKIFGFLNLSMASFFAFVGIYTMLDLTKKFERKPKIKKYKKNRFSVFAGFKKISKKIASFFKNLALKIISFFKKIFFIFINFLVLFFEKCILFFKKINKKISKVLKNK